MRRSKPSPQVPLFGAKPVAPTVHAPTEAPPPEPVHPQPERPTPAAGPLFPQVLPPPSPRRAGIQPVPPLPEYLALRETLPGGLRMGTSSWGFSGWQGLVWADKASDERLSREGLPAYAAHPLLRAVGLDRTHYRTMSAAELAALAAQVPADFRFLVKAHEDCTIARFPGHARYASRRDQANALFLDPGYATDRVVGPAVEGLRGALGVLLFQFAPQPLRVLGGLGAFVDRLHAFLGALPRGPVYAVEVRTPELLGEVYADALHDLGVVPAISAWNGLPPVEEQARLLQIERAPMRVIRWMLQEGYAYEDAKDRYAPFDALVDPDPVTRAAIARLVAHHAGESIVILNNKAEGSAPRSVFALAEAVAHRMRAG